MPNIDLMGCVPDPVDYIQIVPIRRGDGIWFQISDMESGHTLLLDYLTVLKVAGRLSFCWGVS